MSDATDEELIARCQQGDEQAFRDLVERYKNLVFGMVSRSARDPSQVEDLAQEVFLRVHRGLPYFRGEAKLTTWLYRIILNLLSQESQRQRGKREIALDLQFEAGNLAARDRTASDLELRDRLEKAMARLSPTDRLLIAGHYLHDVKYEDLAEALGMPLGTVKTNLHRAKKQLRSMLETHLR